MTWTYKPPQLFPMWMGDRLIQAATSGDQIVYSSHSNYYDAEVSAANLRYYRWCLRHRKTPSSILTEYEDLMDFRAKIMPYMGTIAVMLQAKPNRLYTLLRLNPELDTIINVYSTQHNH